MDVRRLMILRAVRDARGVLAAADELQISSSAVSQQLSKLEREVGLRLVTRGSATRARLTPAGQRLAERADVIDAELRSAQSEIDQLKSAEQRTVRVGGFPSVIQHLLVPAARALRDAVPAVAVQIVEVREEGVAAEAQLRSGRFDVLVAKRHGPHTPSPQITETVIRDDPFRVVIPAIWPIPNSITELFDRPWVKQQPGTAEYEALISLQKQEQVDLRFEHECTEYPVAIALAANGLAACIVPELVIMSTPLDGTAVLTFGEIGQRRIIAQHLDGAAQSVAIRLLLDHLRQPVHTMRPQLFKDDRAQPTRTRDC